MGYILTDIFTFSDLQPGLYFRYTSHGQITTHTVLLVFFLHFNCYIRPKETPSDFTQSRDRQLNQWILPERPMPDTEVLFTVRPQTTFLWHNCINEIFNIVTFIANATQIIPTLTNLPVTVNTLHTSDSPRLHRDKQIEEFLIGEICSCNFINQDLTFLQPSTIYETKTKEENGNLSQASLAELSYDRTRITNRPAPIQPVEPVVGLAPEEQHRKEEDPDLTLDELLGLSSCKDHISTPLQTLDGLYVNQPSQFLALVQEAKKLAKRRKRGRRSITVVRNPHQEAPEQFLYRTAQLHSNSSADCSTSQHKGTVTAGCNNYTRETR